MGGIKLGCSFVALVGAVAALDLTLSYAQTAGHPAERQAFVTSGAADMPLLVRVPHTGGWVEIFHLGKGGCLRGPLRFASPDGKMVFSLGKDNDIPYGCSFNR